MSQRLAVCLCVVLCLVACAAATAAAAAVDRPTKRVSPAPEVNPDAVVWRTSDPPKNPQAGDVWVNPKDGMEMVYIAAGEFILGTSDAQIERGWPDVDPNLMRAYWQSEQPQCRVNLPGYWIGRSEVTNAQYRRFVQATGHRAPDHWKGGQIPSGLKSFPVVGVDWQDARAYCEWAEGRLPSELEWEKAARGTDGRLFPWGNQWDAKRCRNFELITGRTYATVAEFDHARNLWLSSHDPVREGPVAAGSYAGGASPYGCADMAGNVSEWCADWYDWDDGFGYKRYAKGDLKPPESGTYKMLRGGSWREGDPIDQRCAARSCTEPVNPMDGFRCARGLP